MSTTILWACDAPRAPEAITSPGSDHPVSDEESSGSDPTNEEHATSGPLHEAHGITYADLEDVVYEDELTQGIASSRVTLPSGVIFSVISSPDIVPADQAQALQLQNARRGAAQRGPILEDSDAAARRFGPDAALVEGARIIYRNPSQGITHTEVFTFESDRRTVTVFIELTDPPDQHADVIDTLARSLRVSMP